MPSKENLIAAVLLKIPQTREVPKIAMTKIPSFIRVSGSLNNNADRSMTNIGEVYINTEAKAAEVTATFLK